MRQLCAERKRLHSVSKLVYFTENNLQNAVVISGCRHSILARLALCFCRFLAANLAPSSTASSASFCRFSARISRLFRSSAAMAAVSASPRRPDRSVKQSSVSVRRTSGVLGPVCRLSRPMRRATGGRRPGEAETLETTAATNFSAPHRCGREGLGQLPAKRFQKEDPQQRTRVFFA